MPLYMYRVYVATYVSASDSVTVTVVTCTANRQYVYFTFLAKYKGYQFKNLYHTLKVSRGYYPMFTHAILSVMIFVL